MGLHSQIAGCLMLAAVEEEEEEEALIIVIHITPCLCVRLLIDGVFPLDFFGGNNPADVHSFTMRRLLPLPSLSIHYHSTCTRETSTNTISSTGNRLLFVFLLCPCLLNLSGWGGLERFFCQWQIANELDFGALLSKCDNVPRLLIADSLTGFLLLF